ncbi:hypothetical protein [Flavobacterium sp. CF136]|uniref:hypothetical protein n=1 Tax=Flavobacterium sp. (strain CF136) TaxID=1144313 RepID=UPI0002719639|nr:hypothetical protein [Flavobacterium sp. CF136]EJL66271.1 hypothetical protein PMI10_00619 [Flavobacterium sp. CF136]
MTKTITINSDKFINALEKISDKEVEIKGASISDALCAYSYELLKGPTKGDTLNRKGAHIVHDELQIRFDQLDVFYAHLDDAYTGNTNVTPLEELEAEIETEKYHVTGFKISGVEENKSVILSGWKEVTNGIVKFETPKIKYSSAYLYLSEMKERVQNAIDEVELYMNGKTAPQDDPNQVHMSFSEEDAAFDNAKI